MDASSGHFPDRQPAHGVARNPIQGRIQRWIVYEAEYRDKLGGFTAVQQQNLGEIGFFERCGPVIDPQAERQIFG